MNIVNDFNAIIDQTGNKGRDSSQQFRPSDPNSYSNQLELMELIESNEDRVQCECNRRREWPQMTRMTANKEQRNDNKIYFL